MSTKSNPILQSISKWMQRNFSDPGAVGLFFTLLFGFLFIEFFGGFFLPVIISIVIAYLLHSVVRLSVAVPAFISGYYYLYYISRPVYLRYIGFNAVVMETVYEFN